MAKVKVKQMMEIIKTSFLLLLLFFSLFVEELEAGPREEFPVLYQGRFRPKEAYTRLWLYDISHTSHLKSLDPPSALHLLWSLHFKGSLPYHSLPLFWIGSAHHKKELGLPLTRTHFSYQELMQAFEHHPERKEKMASLLLMLTHFEQLLGPFLPLEQAFERRCLALQKEPLSPAKIQQILEQEFPLPLRLKKAGMLFKCLPGRDQAGEWFSLHALKVQSYSPSSQGLEPVTNFSLFSDTQFENIRQAYLALEQAFTDTSFHSPLFQEKEKELSLAIQQAYEDSLAGQIYQQAHGKQLFYPSLKQLQVEALYVHYPWIKGVMALYLLSALWLMTKKGKSLALGTLLLAFFFHTLLLVIRSYVLERPPVANMGETLLYVPWVAVSLSLLSLRLGANLLLYSPPASSPSSSC